MRGAAHVGRVRRRVASECSRQARDRTPQARPPRPHAAPLDGASSRVDSARTQSAPRPRRHWPPTLPVATGAPARRPPTGRAQRKRRQWRHRLWQREPSYGPTSDPTRRHSAARQDEVTLQDIKKTHLPPALSDGSPFALPERPSAGRGAAPSPVAESRRSESFPHPPRGETRFLTSRRPRGH